jgi:hypothetical protein
MKARGEEVKVKPSPDQEFQAEAASRITVG